MSNFNGFQNRTAGGRAGQQQALYPDNLTPPPVRNVIAIVGFIFSILGLAFLIPLFGFLAVPLVMLGLTLSIIGYLRAKGGAPLRPLALAGLVMAGLTLIGGIVVNIVAYHSATQNWVAVDEGLPAPTGAQAEAVVGDWAWHNTEDGTDNPWFRFGANGIGENLSDGERFNWLSDGTFANASTIRNWHVAGDTLTITFITGNTIEYHRIR